MVLPSLWLSDRYRGKSYTSSSHQTSFLGFPTEAKVLKLQLIPHYLSQFLLVYSLQDTASVERISGVQTSDDSENLPLSHFKRGDRTISQRLFCFRDWNSSDWSFRWQRWQRTSSARLRLRERCSGFRWWYLTQLCLHQMTLPVGLVNLSSFVPMFIARVLKPITMTLR